MSIAPQPRDRRPADAHSEKSPALAGRDHWASLLFQAAGDAAETRRRIAVRDEQIQRLTDVATAEWHWNHSQHELDFLIYFDRRDSTQLRAIELTQVDGELPTPYQRLRFEEELETEIAAADELLEHLVARAAEASWPS